MRSYASIPPILPLNRDQQTTAKYDIRAHYPAFFRDDGLTLIGAA